MSPIAPKGAASAAEETDARRNVKDGTAAMGSAKAGMAETMRGTDVTLAELPQGGRANVLRKTGLFMQWQFRRGALAMPVFAAIQVLVSVAVVLGYSLLIDSPTKEVGLYLATGGPTISLVMIGLVVTTQMVAQARTEGSYEWLLSLPIPRLSFLLADLAVWGFLALPGLVLGVVVGAVRFDVDLTPAWWLAVGALLVAVTAASIGYFTAVTMPQQTAMLLSQVFIFLVMLFTPITYPASRLPRWVQNVHEWLPFDAMGQVMRAGLASEDFAMPTRSWILLAVWCVVSMVGAGWAIGRRR